jgi:hypothetical protein
VDHRRTAPEEVEVEVRKRRPVVTKRRSGEAKQLA